MKKQNKNDNAANRKSYVGKIYNEGEALHKNNVLNSINPVWKKLHDEGYIHIHDLDAYGLTYNCLTLDILNGFPYEKFKNMSCEQKIVTVFDFVKELLSNLGNEQSGGMSFANFDIDFSTIFSKLDVDYKMYKKIFEASVTSLILWCNNIHTRMGQTSYYVSFNIGLGMDDYSRFLSSTLIESFRNLGPTVYKPNIIFKVKEGINRFKEDSNYDLLMLALNCTAEKMIPTYLLCDCESDVKTDPYKLSIMGCRTRVVDDLYNSEGAIGRSNIDNITINLPRLALLSSNGNIDCSERFEKFKSMWLEVASNTKDILLDRYYKTCESDIDLFTTIQKYQLTCEDINKVGLEGTFKHGTLSIGFIGLSEAMKVIFGDYYWKDEYIYKQALDFTKFMRDYVDEQRNKYRLNFSLLATSGELISGRFTEIDENLFESDIFKKGYYTNSFHVDVDSGLPAYKKLQLEGPFHKYSNGGCISYIELREAPLGNAIGLDELVEIAVKSGVHYLGFNFPKDICNECGTTGTFDICPSCGSKNILRIRRVSGYLEIKDYFTKGKKNEEKNRRSN